MDLGFAWAGFDIRVAVESDPAACKTLRRNWPALRTRLVQRRMEEVATDELLRIGGLALGEVDLVFGGPPCQSWCIAGNRLGLRDPRGRTLLEFCRVVREVGPRMFCIENVPGFLNHSTDDVLTLIAGDVNRDKRWAYSLSAQVLNGAAFGLPQLRRRAFVVGWRLGGEFHFPTPTHQLPGRPAGPRAKPATTVGGVLAGLPEPLPPSPIGQRVAKTIVLRNKRWYGK